MYVYMDDIKMVSATAFNTSTNGNRLSAPSVMKIKSHCQTSNIRHTLVNRIVDHSDEVGALTVGDASTTSSFST